MRAACRGQRAQPVSQHGWPFAVTARRTPLCVQARTTSNDQAGSADPANPQAPRPKRKYTRRMDPAEVSAICRRNGSKLVEYEGKMVPAYEKGWRMQAKILYEYEGERVTAIEKARRVQAKMLFEHEGEMMTAIEKARRVQAKMLFEHEGEMMTAIEKARRVAASKNAKPPGAIYSRNQVTLSLPPGPWGKGVSVTGPSASQEGGTESPFHHWKDALQLAAHELGVRPAKGRPGTGVHVVTSAGKRYFRSLPPFQKAQPTPGMVEGAIKASTLSEIRARTREIHQRLTQQHS